MSDLSVRSDAAEEMDQETTSLETYKRCLRDLARVNSLTLTHRATLQFLTRATRDLAPGSKISILDVACGHGDLLRAIHRWAKTRGLAVTLEGIDLNLRGAEIATAATPPDMAITYRTGDVFTYYPSPQPDLIVTSQFAHHLTDTDVVKLLRWLDQHAAHGWFIADLHRHAVAYYGFPLLARIAFWHRIVRQDGQISVARSFRRSDWTCLLAQAGIQAEIRWNIPFRYGISRLK